MRFKFKNYILVVRDFGETAEKFSNDLMKVAHCLGDLGQMLKRDDTPTNRNDPRYQRNRRQIQNTNPRTRTEQERNQKILRNLF